MRISDWSSTWALPISGCSAGSSDASAELDSVSIMAPFLVANPPAEGNDIQEALEDVAGVDLDITWVPNSSYGDQVNITLAGDDVPPAMVITRKDSGFVRTAQPGAFWELTDYHHAPPNTQTT